MLFITTATVKVWYDKFKIFWTNGNGNKLYIVLFVWGCISGYINSYIMVDFEIIFQFNDIVKNGQKNYLRSIISVILWPQNIGVLI